MNTAYNTKSAVCPNFVGLFLLNRQVHLGHSQDLWRAPLSSTPAEKPSLSLWFHLICRFNLLSQLCSRLSCGSAAAAKSLSVGFCIYTSLGTFSGKECECRCFFDDALLCVQDVMVLGCWCLRIFFSVLFWSRSVPGFIVVVISTPIVYLSLGLTTSYFSLCVKPCFLVLELGRCILD